MAKSNAPAPRNEKAAQARKKAQAQVRAEQRRTTALWVVAGIVGVAIFATLVTFILRGSSSTGEFSANQLTPTVVDDNGGIPVGKGGVVGEELDPSRVQLEIYFDLRCSACYNFEQYNAAEIDALRSEGVADTVFHPVSILDRESSGTRYSTRSAASAVLVAQEAPAQFAAYVEAVFTAQPKVTARGLSDETLQEIARFVGVPEDVIKRIPEHEYAQWVIDATEKASIRGMQGTPTIFINDVNQDPRINPDGFNWSEEGALRAAIEAAANN